MYYNVVKFQTPSYISFWDMNYFPVMIFGLIQTDEKVSDALGQMDSKNIASVHI